MKPFFRRRTLVQAAQWQPGIPIEGVHETQPSEMDGDGAVKEAIIQTGFGSCTIGAGDWVIKTEDDELYPCKEEEFPSRFIDAAIIDTAPGFVLQYGKELEQFAKLNPEANFIVLAFSLKGAMTWPELEALIKMIAEKNPTAVLIHGFMPAEVVEAKGYSLDVINTLNSCFKNQYTFFNTETNKVDRVAMAKAAKALDATVYVLGDEIAGVHEEVTLYESHGIIKINRVSAEDVIAEEEPFEEKMKEWYANGDLELKDDDADAAKVPDGLKIPAPAAENEEAVNLVAEP